MAPRFTRFRDDLLIALADFGEGGSGYFEAKEAADAANLECPHGWLRKAVEALETKGYVNVSWTLGGGEDGGINVNVKGLGLERAEEISDELRASQAEQKVAPAADRLVPLDHNSATYVEVMKALSDVSTAVATSNEIGSGDEHERGQITAELESGKTLVGAKQVRLNAILAVLISCLKYLVGKFRDTSIGLVAAHAIKLLAALFGLAL